MTKPKIEYEDMDVPHPLLDGILCLTVRQVLLHDAERSMTARIALEELAMSVLTYELAEGYEVWDVHRLAHTTTTITTTATF